MRIWHKVGSLISQNAWIPLPLGTLKCNCDAAFFVEKGITCFVACLRNEGGDFLQARTAFITTNMSVKEGEAIVVLQTLIWLSNQQVYNVIIELDSKLVVDQIHSNEEDISECGMINQIKDIYHEIFSFYDCSIQQKGK